MRRFATVFLAPRANIIFTAAKPAVLSGLTRGLFRKTFRNVTGITTPTNLLKAIGRLFSGLLCEEWDGKFPVWKLTPEPPVSSARRIKSMFSKGY